MLFATAIFLAALALIASERVDRTKVALLGAALVVLAGRSTSSRRSRRSTSTRSACWSG